MDKPLKILIVDDDRTTALIVKAAVSKHLARTEVVLVYDGQEAWDTLMIDDFDLIISDWNMPRKAGDELLYDIRQHKKTKQIPFLMLTVRSS